jgi:CDP-diacylglycerol--glycerol-3-phosphate 3-phosphatidyltransferase
MNNKTITGESQIPLRKRIQLLLYRFINPVVNLLIKKDIAPNTITTVGLFLNTGVAAVFIVGAETKLRTDLTFVGWAGLLILVAGLLDMIDGQVARRGKSVSKFGALYDSVLDRYSELIMYLGICYYLVSFHYFISSIMAFIALIGSLMVSYIRARAEGLGIECKDGLMQRPERIIILGSSAIICGIVSEFLGDNYRLFIKGIPFHVFETISIFVLPIAVLAILSNYTALKRLYLCKKQLQ